MYYLEISWLSDFASLTPVILVLLLLRPQNYIHKDFFGFHYDSNGTHYVSHTLPQTLIYIQIRNSYTDYQSLEQYTSHHLHITTASLTP